MVILSGKGLTKSFGEKEIFSDIDFQVKEGEKVALIGVNGSGKTTLFNCIKNPSLLDSGEIIRNKSIDLGYTEQVVNVDKYNNLLSYLMETFADILKMRLDLEVFEERISTADINSLEYPQLLEDYAQLTEEYEGKNGYAIESKIKGIVKGLGFKESDLHRKLNSFSGGELSKLSLAKILVREPDIILLDEPTNHLDIGAVEWLENYLKLYHGAVLVISHDRRFLNNLVDSIYEFENGELSHFSGNYDFYLKEKELRIESYERQYEKQQKEIAALEAFIDKYKAGVKAKQARGRKKQLEKLEVLSKIKQKKPLALLELQPEKSGQIVLSVENISKSFSDNHIFKGISFKIFQGEKVGIIGDNGTGKSTLLKGLLDVSFLDQGEITIGSRVKVGYFDQHHQNLNVNDTVYQSISKNFDLKKEEIRSVLARFLFIGDDLDKVVSMLSGGEKARLSLLLILLEKPNFLILDEPTNHLDLDSQEIIENFLKDYTGTLLIVSHDRFFLDNIVERIICLEDKKIKEYLGNYTYYRQKLEENQALQEVVKEPKVSLKTVRKNSSLSKSKLKQELEKREKDIEQIESQIGNIEAKIASTSGEDYNQFYDLSQALEAEKIKLDEIMVEWAEISEQLESLI